MIVPQQGEFTLTSESVTSGHPDKVADRIADAVLDAHIGQDPQARVACEVLVTGPSVIVAGEIRSDAEVPISEVVRGAVRELGYDRPELGFWHEGVEILDLTAAQSGEIAAAVDGCEGGLGAGDQGMMVGFACDETTELMPLPIVLAHGLTRRLTEARSTGAIPWLRPDGKAQVSVRYRDGLPVDVAAVLVSCQHDPGVAPSVLRETVIEAIVRPTFQGVIRLAGDPLINPSGSFVVGGPVADTGLTGRKLAVDTYGGAVPHGGGAFSGKDATKVDRSGAYAARQAAKAIVGAGLARKALVQIAYAIGRPDPLAVAVTTGGTGLIPDREISRLLNTAIDFRPAAVIERLSLRRPIYQATSAFGHFGRGGPEFAWEATREIENLLNESHSG